MTAWRPPQGHLLSLVEAAHEDSAGRRRQRPDLALELRDVARVSRGFLRALQDSAPGTFPLICEVKRASPSQGTLRASADAPAQAQAYARGGARCISVLTEPRRFQGSLADLAAVRQAVEHVPLLRKDFIVNAYMVQEAAFFGADAILLIAGALPPAQNAQLAGVAQALGLDVLLEFVHPHELEALGQVDTPLLGVNARDLETLEVDVERFSRLAPQLAATGRLLVAESGVKRADDVRRFSALGAGAVLVGESLMRAPDPAAQVRELAHAMAGTRADVVS